MKQARVFPIRNPIETSHRTSTPSGEINQLMTRLQSASRKIAKTVLREIRDFSNSIQESAAHASEIDRRIRERKDEYARKGLYYRGPLI
jgi:uncharacterized protein with PhoU and TrkA domain